MIIIIASAALVIVLSLYAALVVSSRADDEADKMPRKRAINNEGGEIPDKNDNGVKSGDYAPRKGYKE